MYAKVVFALPFRKSFTYKIPVDIEEYVVNGVRVVAPFGKRVLTGLPAYILMLSAIATALLTLATGAFYQSVNLSELLSMDADSIVGKLLMLVDVFMIWYFAVVSIAYAKIFGGKGLANYIVIVFGFWLVISATFILIFWSLIYFILLYNRM